MGWNYLTPPQRVQSRGSKNYKNQNQIKQVLNKQNSKKLNNIKWCAKN